MVAIDRSVCELLGACDEDDYALWEIAAVYNQHAATRLTPDVIFALVEQDLVCLVDSGTSEVLPNTALKPEAFSQDDPTQIRLRITDNGRRVFLSDACAALEDDAEFDEE